MAITVVTSENLRSVLSGADIVLLDFWAGWCAPCRRFAPIYGEASRHHPDITFGTVDVQAQSDIAGAYGIGAIPTLFAFRRGLLVFGQPGAMDKSGLEHLIAGVRGLDMEGLRHRMGVAAADGI